MLYRTASSFHFLTSHHSSYPHSLSLHQCDRTTALESLFNQILHSPTKVGWVGSGCSVATEPTAELTHFYNITQVTAVRHMCMIYQQTSVYAYQQHQVHRIVCTLIAAKVFSKVSVCRYDYLN